MKHRLGLATAIPAALLIFALILTLAFACSGLTASAAGDPRGATETSRLEFGQMSDIHYFPEEYCYPSTAEGYEDSDFYHSTTGDTKLVIESGDILSAHVEDFIDDAREGIAPTYLFATGDLSKNGERVALVDVANKLRYLQNEVRALTEEDATKYAKYANFQVFAVQGNHDLYNGSGKLYDATGNEYQAEVVTSAQFALIFTGLGYPDVDYDTLRSIYPEEYWSSDYTNGYVSSNNANNVTIRYFNTHLANIAENGFRMEDYTALFGGENINALSYYATVEGSDYGFFVLDGTDREIVESVTPVRVSKDEYEAVIESLAGTSAKYNAANNLEDNDAVNFATFYLENEDGSISSTPADAAAIHAAFVSGDPVYVNTAYDHLTGGRLTEPLLDWMRDITADGADKTYVRL